MKQTKKHMEAGTHPDRVVAPIGLLSRQEPQVGSIHVDPWVSRSSTEAQKLNDENPDAKPVVINAPFRAAVVKELWKTVSEEDKAGYAKRAEAQSQLEKEKLNIYQKEGVPLTPEFREECIEDFKDFIWPLATRFTEITGLHFFCMIGGLRPSANGEIWTSSVYNGVNRAVDPVFWPASDRLRFRRQVVDFFREYLDGCFTCTTITTTAQLTLSDLEESSDDPSDDDPTDNDENDDVPKKKAKGKAKAKPKAVADDNDPMADDNDPMADDDDMPKAKCKGKGKAAAEPKKKIPSTSTPSRTTKATKKSKSAGSSSHPTSVSGASGSVASGSAGSSGGAGPSGTGKKRKEPLNETQPPMRKCPVRNVKSMADKAAHQQANFLEPEQQRQVEQALTKQLAEQGRLAAVKRDADRVREEAMARRDQVLAQRKADAQHANGLSNPASTSNPVSPPNPTLTSNPSNPASTSNPASMSKSASNSTSNPVSTSNPSNPASTSNPALTSNPASTPNIPNVGDTVQMPYALTCPTNAAPWFKTMWPELVRFDLSAKFWTLVQELVLLEAAYGYMDRQAKLPTTCRPQLIATWFHLGRVWKDNKMSIPDVAAYRKEWVSWWEARQPPWRRSGVDNSLARVTSDGRPWGYLALPGSSELGIVVVSLGWWGHALFQSTTATVEWALTMFCGVRTGKHSGLRSTSPTQPFNMWALGELRKEAPATIENWARVDAEKQKRKPRA
uniref:HMG box domain-containing protein n=1 Tax=Mycena chlorophos TaxID=658473 RepID=A0ABQ0LCR2_MYCCL|nr:predicted protein [Mycena chlorophos]